MRVIARLILGLAVAIAAAACGGAGVSESGAPVPSETRPASDGVGALLNRARDAQKRGDLDGALNAVNEALQNNPQLSEALELQGQIVQARVDRRLAAQ